MRRFEPDWAKLDGELARIRVSGDLPLLTAMAVGYSEHEPAGRSWSSLTLGEREVSYLVASAALAAGRRQRQVDGAAGPDAVVASMAEAICERLREIGGPAITAWAQLPVRGREDWFGVARAILTAAIAHRAAERLAA